MATKKKAKPIICTHRNIPEDELSDDGLCLGCQAKRNTSSRANALVALRAYARRVRLNIHDEGFELVLSDMLADLAHFCDTEGVEIDECLARAENHYGNESPKGTQSFHANHHTSTDPPLLT